VKVLVQPEKLSLPAMATMAMAFFSDGQVAVARRYLLKCGQQLHIASLRERNDGSVERNQANSPTARERKQMCVCHLAVTDDGWNVVVDE
jgi:hypothetical protein